MTAKKLLNEWYGMSDKVPTNLAKWSYYYTSETVPQEVKDVAERLLGERAAYRFYREYTPPCDGSTDRDFIKWMLDHTSIGSDDYKRSLGNWKATDVYEAWLSELKINPKTDWENDWRITQIIKDLYVHDSPRNDRLFRIIELNEFLTRGSEDQTFENFLLTDTEYEDKCRSKILSSSAHALTLIKDELPDFLKFGPRTATKTRNLLLPLTVSEMTKVLDIQKNPTLWANPKASFTAEYAKMFIDTALNIDENQMILSATDPKEIRNVIATAFLCSATKKYWMDRSKSDNIPSTIEIAMDEISKMDINSPLLCRDFAYLVQSESLDRLTPDEVMAVAHAYDKPHRWAATLKGKGAVNIVTELIYHKKVDPTLILRLIAYTVVNNTTLIKIEEDFPWETLADVPPMWSHETLAVKTKCKLVVPASIRCMSPEC